MKPRIHYTKPSITELEVRYATDAATNGWGEKCYEYINRFEGALKPIWPSSTPLLHRIVTTVMLFLAPVFYPVTALPEEFRPWLMANPLTFIIEQAREVLIWGRLPNWGGLGIYTLAATAVAWAGYAWLQKTRKGFADVL